MKLKMSPSIRTQQSNFSTYLKFEIVELTLDQNLTVILDRNNASNTWLSIQNMPIFSFFFAYSSKTV